MIHAPDSISWIGEARAQDLCGLTRPAWKSWARAKLIEEDAGGAYDERQVLEVALVGGLRNHLSPQDTRLATMALKRNGRWEAMLAHARDLQEDDRFDLVIEPRTCAVRLALDDAALVRAVRHPEDPRLVLVVSLADRMRRIRDGFRAIAVVQERPIVRKVGRPRRAAADVHPIRPRPTSSA